MLWIIQIHVIRKYVIPHLLRNLGSFIMIVVRNIFVNLFLRCMLYRHVKR